MAKVDNPRADTVEALDRGGRANAPIAGGFVERYAEAYAREMDHFAAVLAGEMPPATGYDDNVRALALAEAAVRSVATGGRVRTWTGV